MGIGNQLLATIVLWTSAAYLVSKGKPHWMCSVPAAFLTFVCTSYFLMAPYKAGGFHLMPEIGYVTGIALSLSLLILCIVKSRKSAR